MPKKKTIRRRQAIAASDEGSGIPGCSALARASQRADLYNRHAAELLMRIGQLPHDDPEAKAAPAKLRAMRPKALEAMDEVRALEIRYTQQLRDTPTEDMSRA